jgi:hypothetical protein
MLAVRINFAHFVGIDHQSVLNSADDNGIGTLPRLLIRSFTLGVGETGIDLPVELFDYILGDGCAVLVMNQSSSQTVAQRWVARCSPRPTRVSSTKNHV